MKDCQGNRVGVHFIKEKKQYFAAKASSIVIRIKPEEVFVQRSKKG